MLMIARFGRVGNGGGPADERIVSMLMVPAVAVWIVVRVYPGNAGGPGGMANGTPKTRVFGFVGVRWTVTTLVGVVVTVTVPSGVWTLLSTVQESPHVLSACAEGVAKPNQ
jgi:hypothetical protein